MKKGSKPIPKYVKYFKTRTKKRIRKTTYEAITWERLPSGKRKLVARRNFPNLEKLRIWLNKEFGEDERELETLVNKSYFYFNGLILTFHADQRWDNSQEKGNY